MRAWFNGRMEASQALDEGSIPFARFLIGLSMQNDSQEFEEKPSSNKDMWLFLIVLDVIFLCVFGFFLYKQFSGRLFNPIATETTVSTQEQTLNKEPLLPTITEEEVISVAQLPAPQEPTLEETTIVEEPVKPISPIVEEMQPTLVKNETKESIVVVPTTGKYRRVTFRWFGEGNQVAVVSGFTMSKPQALKKVGDHWETTLSIAPGTYKFLYIIDGKNTLDPYAQEKDGRSVLIVK